MRKANSTSLVSIKKSKMLFKDSKTRAKTVSTLSASHLSFNLDFEAKLTSANDIDNRLRFTNIIRFFNDTIKDKCSSKSIKNKNSERFRNKFPHSEMPVSSVAYKSQQIKDISVSIKEFNGTRNTINKSYHQKE